MREQITQTSDIEARELHRGDDLFGAGEVKSAVWVGGSVQVQAGGTSFTFWPDETVTVRRAISHESLKSKSPQPLAGEPEECLPQAGLRERPAPGAGSIQPPSPLLPRAEKQAKDAAE